MLLKKRIAASLCNKEVRDRLSTNFARDRHSQTLAALSQRWLSTVSAHIRTTAHPELNDLYETLSLFKLHRGEQYEAGAREMSTLP